MDERARFVFEAENGHLSFAALCRRYAISRPTGYKWLRRHEEEGSATWVIDPTGPGPVPMR